MIAIDAPALLKRCEDDHELGYQIMLRFTKTIFGRLEATRKQLVDSHEALRSLPSDGDA
jgi:hypothetical protein